MANTKEITEFVKAIQLRAQFLEQTNKGMTAMQEGLDAHMTMLQNTEKVLKQNAIKLRLTNEQLASDSSGRFGRLAVGFLKIFLEPIKNYFNLIL